MQLDTDGSKYMQMALKWITHLAKKLILILDRNKLEIEAILSKRKQRSNSNLWKQFDSLSFGFINLPKLFVFHSCTLHLTDFTDIHTLYTVITLNISFCFIWYTCISPYGVFHFVMATWSRLCQYELV